MTPDTEQATPVRKRSKAERRADLQVRQTAARKAAFLQALGNMAVGDAWPNISKAARELGIERADIYRWQESDGEFADRMAEIIRTAVDRAEAVAFGLGTGEFSKPLASAGKIVGEEQIYSEKMLELFLRSHRPDTYQEERRLLIKHEGQVLQQVLATFEAALDYAGINEAQRARIAEYVRSRPLQQAPQLIEAQAS